MPPSDYAALPRPAQLGATKKGEALWLIDHVIFVR